MIISRTPFRISFFGGGTDYPGWYQNYGGSTISTSINKFCYITLRHLPPFFDYKSRLRYFKTEYINDINNIEHPSIKEVLKYYNYDQGIEILHTADLPAQSGLGSSSAFTVGLLNALNALQNKKINKRQLAYEAIHIEQNLIKENVGSQDQTIAAFGGFNKIDYGSEYTFQVTPIMMKKDILKKLEDHCLLFFTGFSRNASHIAKDQVNNIKKNKAILFEMMKITENAELALYQDNILDFAELLNVQWNLKKKLANNISSNLIDEIYNLAIKNGAYGGKLLGAGSGGFLLFLAKPELHSNIKKSLNNFLNVPIRFENLGSQIIYYTQ